MSLEEAKVTLGFPPGYVPNSEEIAKAYRRMAIQNHPDRGGSHEKMVEINVAKEVLEGRRHDRFQPSKSPQEEQARKRNVALTVVDIASKEVAQAVDACMLATDLGRGKIHLRDFFLEEYSDALDKMQDMIEEAPHKDHPDMRKAEALCQSLVNKSVRLGKKYLNLLKLQGEMTASLLGMGGKPLNYEALTNLFAETRKYLLAFHEMWQESRKLIGLIRTSEDVPLAWDDLYHRPHNILDAFAGDWAGFSNRSLQTYEKVMTKAVADIGKAILDIAPEEWRNAPSMERWRYPEDFDWAKGVVQRTSKTAAARKGPKPGRESQEEYMRQIWKSEGLEATSLKGAVEMYAWDLGYQGVKLENWLVELGESLGVKVRSLYRSGKGGAQESKKASVDTKWVTGNDRKDLMEAIWEMYRASYQKIGMHVTSPMGLLEYDKWEVIFNEEGPIAFNLYKTTPLGLKTGLLGSDGSTAGKSAIKEHIRSRYKRPGVYGEVSHSVEKLSEGAPVVCAVHVPNVLGKAILPQEDGVHYARKLEGIGLVVKKLVGNPKGIPSGAEGRCPIPDNPGQPLSPEDAPKNASAKLSQEIELAEHAACQLNLDD